MLELQTDYSWLWKETTPQKKKRKSKKLIYRDSGVAKSLKIFQIKQKKNHGYKKNMKKPDLQLNILIHLISQTIKSEKNWRPKGQVLCNLSLITILQ